MISLAFAAILGGCSGARGAQCVRSGDVKICYVRDDAAAGTFEASGLLPGSTLTVSSRPNGEQTYQIGADGTLDGGLGFINSTGVPVEATVTGTTSADEILTGAFET